MHIESDIVSYFTFLTLQMIQGSNKFFRVVMLSLIYLPFALGLNIILYFFLNSLYTSCPFIVTTIIAKITV